MLGHLQLLHLCWSCLQLIARAYPYIAKRLLTDEAEELRGALEEFLIQNGSFRSTRSAYLDEDLRPKMRWPIFQYHRTEVFRRFIYC